MNSSIRKAVFLDKDGTLVRNVPYNVDPRRIVLYPDALAALKMMTRQGFEPIVVSNQPGVARGYFEEGALQGVESTIREKLESQEVPLRGFYYCPHDPKGVVPQYALECDCQKPRPGLLRMAAEEMNIDLHSSWMIGDILNDVEAGNRAGCRSVLVDRGNETEWESGPYRSPHAIVTNLLDAATHVVGSASTEVTAGGLQ